MTDRSEADKLTELQKPLRGILSGIYIGNLSTENVTVKPGDTAEDVYGLFLKNDMLSGVAVVQSGAVKGIVTRTRIDHIMSGQYGYSLNARRPVALIMDTKPLVVDFQAPIDIVSRQAMLRSASKLYDFIIVTNGGSYSGVVTIKDLLEKTMEIEVSDAKHQNPLSGLPGNLMIERNLEKCVFSSEPFTVLYLDLDNFKAYNDVYGFENGDNVIRFVAGILGQVVPESCFVGHVGGDDFIAILHSYQAQEFCQEIVEKFDRGVNTFYSEKDLRKGYITAKNRKGEEDQFPIMSISIAGVTNRNARFKNIYELSEYASNIKKKCKRIWKSCFCVD